MGACQEVSKEQLMNGKRKEASRGTIIQSIDRAAQILRCFENSRELRITDLSQQLGLHKSTISGLVNTLCYLNFLGKDEISGKYRLGTELFRLGSMVDISLRNIVAPYLEDLVEKYQETANLLIPESTNVLYIEKIESPHSMRICTEIGRMLPMYCTAAGKAMLAAMDEQEADALISRMEIMPFTENTVRSKEELLVHIDKVKRAGFAIDDEEYELGLVCVGTAILGNNGHPVGAISISGPITRMGEKTCNDIAMVLLDYSSKISRQL